MDAAIAKQLSIASIENSASLLQSASLVRGGGSPGHAFGLLTLAAEELAKAQMYSNLVTGRATLSKPAETFQTQFSAKDFLSHSRKDEVFAEMVIYHTLVPLILNRYWRERGPGTPIFNLEGLDPDDFQAFADLYFNMDPGIAASLLDSTGRAEKRMDILTTLALRIGDQKNDGFYVDFREGKVVSPGSIEESEYDGLREVIEWLLANAEP